MTGYELEARLAALEEGLKSLNEKSPQTTLGIATKFSYPNGYSGMLGDVFGPTEVSHLKADLPDWTKTVHKLAFRIDRDTFGIDGYTLDVGRMNFAIVSSYDDTERIVVPRWVF